MVAADDGNEHMLLRDVTVLEMANVISGSLTGVMLADLGAEVIKVEAVGSGDPFHALLSRIAAHEAGPLSMTAAWPPTN